MSTVTTSTRARPVIYRRALKRPGQCLPRVTPGDLRINRGAQVIGSEDSVGRGDQELADHLATRKQDDERVPVRWFQPELRQRFVEG